MTSAFSTKSLPDLKKSQKQNFDRARSHFKSGRKSKLKFYFLVPLILLLSYFVTQALSWTYLKVSDFSLADIVWSFSSDLDISNQHTSILLLGHGGGDHDGADLTDTIMVATLDHRLQTVSLVSIPRDLFVSVSGFAPTRINAIWQLAYLQNEDSEEGYDLIKTVVESIIDEPIHYHLRVSFDGFKNIINSIGGVDVKVETSFTDYQYPNYTHGWQTISFKNGTQHFNGERALQFARSRHGDNGSGSDFQRALRQQKIIQAARSKVLSAGTLADPSKLKSLYNALETTFETNLSLTEILALAKFGFELDQTKIFSFSLTDGFDGFLYTPNADEREQFYSGQFILLPLGNNWKIIQSFIDMVWHQGEVFLENTPIRILNGTTTQGLAQDCVNYLNRYHLNPVQIGNAGKIFPETLIYDHTLQSNPITLKILKTLTNGSETQINPAPSPTQADLTLILGNNTKCKTW